MTLSPLQVLTLENFLSLPALEESPAWEFIDGAAIQKPMPKTRHSILQKRLLSEIDAHSKDYTALPELRCTFGGRSIVPDIAVVEWNRIPVNSAGEPEDNFMQPPDWTIEILSPDQNATRVIDNILHCLRHGSRLGWMLDPDDYSVLSFMPQQEPDVYRVDRQLPVIEGVDLNLTTQQLFSWLKIARR
ncbi:MAG: Uma2 family endonuclease [Plectolyngbya sp. WJT66-NPBG17]|jgi:Uma2 family endonuclease|nr:Uma2 family endonuclease [Plectolyngbya sp. WJT66-NPBG17]MBW4527987.1 Uma2 family endonuclease [Phormidium tanganyikae FI6-MK23]